MSDPTEYCPTCDKIVVLKVEETCCSITWKCSECGRTIELQERSDEPED